MMPEEFDTGGWIERVAAALAELAHAQGPYLGEYWRHNPREYVMVDGRDETPFPLGDVRGLYFEVRYAKVFGREAYYVPLRAVHDSARHALLTHPALEWVAVAGRIVGENDFWMRILNSSASISASDLIAGLMARAAELSDDCFRAAAHELDAFLSPAGDGKAAGVLGTLDEACDTLLFYGLTVTERIDFGDGTAILPCGEVRRFVNQELVEELAPGDAGFHGWRPVGAIVRPFRWRPVFRRSGSLNEPLTASPEPFFREAGMFLDLIVVSHAAPVLPLAAVPDCIDRSGGRLLGREKHGSGVYRKWPADGFDGFAECPVLKQSALDEAREAFEGRGSARFKRFSPFVGRLAEALGRHGRFADEVRTVNVAIALEGMYELPKWRKSRKLANRASGFLATDVRDRQRVRKSVLRFYEARSEIVHGGRQHASPFRNGAAFVAGFDFARRTLIKLLREGAPEDWNELEVADD